MLKPNIIRLAILQAQKVEIYRDYRTVFRFGGVLFKKNIILNTGRNYPKKTHPLSNSPFKYQHCEFNTILGVPKYLLRGSSLFILRLTMDDKFTLAKPCDKCMFLIKQAEIKHLHYTDENEKIISMRL